jgi:endonuclease/exonuclease/phosphatase family metal-dependent hydrolase
MADTLPSVDQQSHFSRNRPHRRLDYVMVAEVEAAVEL